MLKVRLRRIRYIATILDTVHCLRYISHTHVLEVVFKPGIFELDLI